MSPNTSFEESLRDAGGKIPAETVPPALRERVRVAVSAETPSRNRRGSWVPRLALAGVAALAIGAAVIYAPRNPLVAPGHAATMKQAIANARTWHFVGWRLKDGKKTRWEVWGRRSPFLYREQIGGELIIDDGKKRVHLLPKSDSDGRATGSVLILPSAPLSRHASGVRDEQTGAFFLAGVNGDTNLSCGTRSGDSYVCTGRVEYMGFPEETHEETILTVDGKTHLPTHYVVKRKLFRTKGNPKDHSVEFGKGTFIREYTEAELTPEYDGPVADSIADYTVPTGYGVTDATVAPTGVAQDGSVSTKQGLTLKATVLQQDGTGNLKLRFDGWLGSEPIRYAKQALGLNIRVIPEMTTQTLPFGTVDRSAAVFDDRGNKYIEFGQPPWTSMNREHPEAWLTPTEPFDARVTRPRTVKIYAHVSLARYERMGNSGRDVPVTEQQFVFDVPLPETKTALVWEKAPDSEGMEYVGIRPTFRMETAERRASYYSGTANQLGEADRNLRLVEEFRKRMPDARLDAKTRDAMNADREKHRKVRGWYRTDSYDRARYWYGVVKAEAERIPYPMMRELAEKNLTEIDRVEKKYGAADAE